MTSINLLAIVMVVLGAGSAHLIGSYLWKDAPAKTYLLVGVVILVLDVACRARKRVEKPKERWFGSAHGGAISIFPVWVLGLFGIAYELLRLYGVRF
jgi:hypothetical protein